MQDKLWYTPCNKLNYGQVFLYRVFIKEIYKMFNSVILIIYLNFLNDEFETKHASEIFIYLKLFESFTL